MSTVILKHLHNEGPGTIEEYLKNKDMSYRVIEIYNNEPIPSVDDFSILVVLGGTMSVNDEDRYAFIGQELRLIEDALWKGKRVIGICLGAQLIAKALGSRVYKGEVVEAGWGDIVFTNNGLRDTNIRKLAMHPSVGDLWQRIKVFQWHGETFDIPKDAEHLASSELYPNQAFRYNQFVYAFQFHIEVTKGMITDWMSNEPIDKGLLNRDTENYYDMYYGRAKNFYESFFRLD